MLGPFSLFLPSQEQSPNKIITDNKTEIMFYIYPTSLIFMENSIAFFCVKVNKNGLLDAFAKGVRFGYGFLFNLEFS